MRSLWTAATGMKAQQFNIDTISNNLANVNTTSYKVHRAEFKDLFYANIKRSNLVEGEGRPINLEVGHGVMPTATKRDFRTGSLLDTEGTFDLAINGSGFFEIEMPNGIDYRYTRDGSFKLSMDGDDATLVTSEGYYVMGEGGRIIIESELRDIIFDESGEIYGLDEDGEITEIDRIILVDFMNPEGLKSEGQNLYSETAASGDPMDLEDDQINTTILQGYLEGSNVQVVDEMVKMITAQRAYEINSKTITTSDEMMQMANNLKR